MDELGHSRVGSETMTTIKLQDAIRAFVKVPVAYDATGDTPAARRESRRKLQSEWADGFWSALERCVGKRVWESPELSTSAGDDEEVLRAINEFVVSAAHNADLIGALGFWAGKVGGYRTTWAKRFAKILFDLGVRDEGALVRHAYAYLNAIKFIRKLLNDKKLSKQLNLSRKAQWKSIAAKTAREFSLVVKEMGNVEVRNRWMGCVRHYLVKLCESEEDLATVFTEARNARAHGEITAESTVSYAWILHDCLKQATDGFKNRKLVELFLSEIKSLPLNEFPSQKPSDIGSCLSKDIKRGEDFLSGMLETRILLRQGNVAQAISALVQKVREQPENLALKCELIEQCVSNNDFVSAFDSVNYFLTPGHVEMKVDGDGGLEKNVVGALGKQQIEKLIGALTRYVFRFPRDNSVRFYSKDDGRRIPNWRIFKEGLAAAYVGFVREYVKGHLDASDRLMEMTAQGHPRKSLSERVCECLFRCVVNGVDAEKRPLIEKNAWVVGFIREEYSFGTGWKADGERMVARLELQTGKLEAARAGFEKCISKNPQDNENWYWLGKTFAYDDARFANCMCKAIVLERTNFYACEAHAGLAQYFESIGRKAEQLRELQSYVKLTRKKNVSSRVASRIPWMRLIENVEAAAENDEELMAMAEQANELISVAQRECSAVVVSYKKSPRIARVYVVDADGGHFANVPVAAPDVEQIVHGMPVTVVFSCENARVPIKMFSRAAGMPWDVFPTSAGIVLGVDKNYGFVQVALDNELISLVDERRFPSVTDAQTGDLFSLRYEVRGGRISVYSCEKSAESAELPAFVKETVGLLSRPNARCEFGYVGDVFVPRELGKDVPGESDVAVCAVKVPVQPNKKASWQAVRIKLKEFKKGGGGVPRG